jgi:phosphopantetheinyl transferase
LGSHPELEERLVCSFLCSLSIKSIEISEDTEASPQLSRRDSSRKEKSLLVRREKVIWFNGGMFADYELSCVKRLLKAGVDFLEQCRRHGVEIYEDNRKDCLSVTNCKTISAKTGRRSFAVH